ncbi:MAG: hypothetical protein ABIW83_05195 [Allosphingosinicella sp.]
MAAVPIAACIPTPPLIAPKPDRRLWDQRIACYHQLVARAERAAAAGWFREANDRHYRDFAAAEARFGSRKEAERSPEGKKVWDAIWGRMVDAENLYWEQCSEPMTRAAVALILTPVPDADALIAKLRVIR